MESSQLNKQFEFVCLLSKHRWEQADRGANAANPIEVIPSNRGFALQQTQFKMNALGAPGMVPAVAVAGAAATNLRAAQMV